MPKLHWKLGASGCIHDVGWSQNSQKTDDESATAFWMGQWCSYHCQNSSKAICFQTTQLQVKPVTQACRNYQGCSLLLDHSTTHYNKLDRKYRKTQSAGQLYKIKPQTHNIGAWQVFISQQSQETNHNTGKDRNDTKATTLRHDNIWIYVKIKIKISKQNIMNPSTYKTHTLSS